MTAVYYGFLKLSSRYATISYAFLRFVEGDQKMYEIFAKLLKERGVTPYQVSKATGVSQSSLSDWKNGKSKPKYEKMKLIAGYFGVSVDYLIGNEKAPTVSGGREIEMDDFTYAMHNHSGNLTEKDKEILLSMASQLAAARKKRKQNGETD